MSRERENEPEKKHEVLVDVLEETIDIKDLILHNDDFNTFDFVIESLIEICGHNPIQAEQCTMIIHYKGKCAVKKGTLEELMPMHQRFLEKGITSEIK